MSYLGNTTLKDFRDFVLRGNLVDLAVAFILGLAFAGVVGRFTDLVTNIIAIPGDEGGPGFESWRFTVGGGVFRYGAFLNAVLNFLIVAAILFFFVVRPVNVLIARRKTDDPTTRDCPECLSEIPVAARRCSFCTSLVSVSG
jgi:large conductance mechanosensitive channel